MRRAMTTASVFALVVLLAVGDALDIASGAVLLAAVGSVMVGGLVCANALL